MVNRLYQPHLYRQVMHHHHQPLNCPCIVPLQIMEQLSTFQQFIHQTPQQSNGTPAIINNIPAITQQQIEFHCPQYVL